MLLLDRDCVKSLGAPADYLAAVELAFLAAHEGRAASPPPLHVAAEEGGFHAKGAILRGDRSFAAVKVNGNFPGNREKFGLPTIQGAILLCDGANGRLLAIMDSIEITLRRTAAATALAARLLAKPESGTLAICGCGDQGRVQAEALAALFPFRAATAWDIDDGRAHAFAEEMSRTLGFPVSRRPSPAEAVRDADIVVTCTTARSPFLAPDQVSPGAFIAAVGTDNPEKSEIAPGLMAQARVVVDSLEQCLAMGDLHHAVAEGSMRAADIQGELAEIVAGARGRNDEADIVIFDSTGTALQDVASAAMIYERAIARRAGVTFSLA